MGSVRTAGAHGTGGAWELLSTAVRMSARSPDQVRENGRHRSDMVTSLVFLAVCRG